MGIYIDRNGHFYFRILHSYIAHDELKYMNPVYCPKITNSKPRRFYILNFGYLKLRFFRKIKRILKGLIRRIDKWM